MVWLWSGVRCCVIGLSRAAASKQTGLFSSYGNTSHYYKVNLLSSKSSSPLTSHPSTLSDRIFEPNLTVDKFASLFGPNDVECRSQIEHILLTYEREKYTESMEVPTTLTVKDMADLLRVYHDERELFRCLRFLYKRECTKFTDSRKKAAKKAEILEAKKVKYNNTQDSDEWQTGIWDAKEESLVYGLWHNALLSRITKQSVRDYRGAHLLRLAAMFGQRLIIDLDYDQHMKLFEARLLAAQIGILYYENRMNRSFPNAIPFDIHFTNCGKSTNTIEALPGHIKRMDQLTEYFHPGSYLDLPDLFPRSKLVYLSPHAPKSLKYYSHDDIYIVGGYNDKSSHIQVSHVKAKAEGIRCARLPLDENVLWKQGNKNLCLNQVTAILQAVAETGDWRSAIQHFAPQRKIKSAEESALENELRKRKMKTRLASIEKSYRIEK